MHPLGQHFLAGLDGTSVTAEVRELILKEKVLGFTLFKWNIEGAAQLMALTAELKALARQAGYELFLAVDQEGGRVQRLPKPFTRIPAMREWAKVCGRQGGAAALFELGKILGREVRLAGFNLDFAPVVDIDTNEKNPIIGDRAFASDPETVFHYAREVIRGLIHENVIPCIKHFPGHGATSQDSHLELPTDTRGFAEIMDCDVLPFRKLIEENLAPTLMTAHVLYPHLDSHNPATLSRRVVHDVLRCELGYDGVVFSDDFLMKAIADHHDLAAAAREFFGIGGDVVLICKHPALTLEALAKLKAQVKGTDPLIAKLGEAKRRIDTLKSRFFPSFHKEEPLEAVVARHQEYVNKVFAG